MAVVSAITVSTKTVSVGCMEKLDCRQSRFLSGWTVGYFQSGRAKKTKAEPNFKLNVLVVLFISLPAVVRSLAPLSRNYMLFSDKFCSKFNLEKHF